ncbi:MAG: winged helix-turn-helix transcriptional regulator [Solirubrobacteraceae bacterium]
MLKRTYENQVCSIAGTLELIGERWTLLILRDIFLGIRRFDDLQRELGIARNVLRDRLNLLVDADILEKRPYQERPPRFDYRLTEKGIDLWPVMHSMMSWGDKHTAGDDGPPTVVEHRDCGGRIDEHAVCEKCGEPVGARDVRAKPGPGAPPDHPWHTARALAHR